ncbi:MAG: carbamate kinase [Bacteroidales bacterium]|nr:carbamate kinase [Bacteroidales bacterium]
MKKLAVVALGGNALQRKDQRGSIEDQEKNTYETLKHLLFLIQEGYDLIISHGNGPQVGDILMRNEAGQQNYDIPPMPLDVCVADSQGGIGYMIERLLRNLFIEHGIEKDILTLVTQVVVDKDDPAFSSPSKRIGKLYTKEESEALSKSTDWVFKRASTRKGEMYRRVVPSPHPKEIFNKKTIEDTAKNGVVVIAAGGGGIPVYRDKDGIIQPIEAVIDKDLVSALLAAEVNAQEFYILTDVPYIFANFGTEKQEVLEFLDVKDAEKHLNDGQFSEGSMLPKVKAAINFVKNGGEKSVITEATKLDDRRYGSKITHEYQMGDKPHQLNVEV